jgi:hypothetical protein
MTNPRRFERAEELCREAASFNLPQHLTCSAWRSLMAPNRIEANDRSELNRVAAAGR